MDETCEKKQRDGQASVVGPMRQGQAETSPVRADLRVGESILDVYDRMLGELDMERVLRRVTDVACESLDAERASVYLLTPETGWLEAVAVVGNVPQRIRVEVSANSLAGFCALSRRALVVPDAYGDLSGIDSALHFDRSWDKQNHFRTRDVMCAPALFKGELVGVVQVLNHRGAGRFGQEHLEALRNVSRLVGYALYHARLYDDLTSLKQLEKEKAQFVRVLVHELKSPLAAAKMLADAMALGQEAGPVRSFADRIAERMSRMKDLIKDILELAQVSSGEALGEIAVFDVAQETAGVCQGYAGPAQQKGLELAVDVGADAVRVRMDRQGFYLVVSNLVSNAVKYTQAGTVRVTVRQAAGRAVLTVADNGIGIPAKDMSSLFREFFRASNARRQNISGSGVGLTAVKRIVERFEGQITLDSRENEGTTFEVSLPVYAG